MRNSNHGYAKMISIHALTKSATAALREPLRDKAYVSPKVRIYNNVDYIFPLFATKIIKNPCRMRGANLLGNSCTLGVHTCYRTIILLSFLNDKRTIHIIRFFYPDMFYFCLVTYCPDCKIANCLTLYRSALPSSIFQFFKLCRVKYTFKNRVLDTLAMVKTFFSHFS